MTLGNTIKHRAHKLAYQKVAKLMLETQDSELSIEGRKLVQLIVDNLEYKNWEIDGVPNLWEVLSDSKKTKNDLHILGIDRLKTSGD